MKTIVGLYVQPEGATKAAQALDGAGFSASSVRVLRSMAAMWQHLVCAPVRLPAAYLAIGAILGMVLWWLFGVLGAVGEDGLGFDLATAVWALVIFAVLGGVVGGMFEIAFGMGSLEQENRRFIAVIRRGGALLVLRTADEHADRAMDVLRQTNAEGVKVCWQASDHPQHQGLSQPKDRLSLWSRRAAKGLGLGLNLLVLPFLIGEGLMGEDMPNLSARSLSNFFFLLAVVVMLIGIVVAWRWGGAGVLLIIGGVLLLKAIDAIQLLLGLWRD